MIFSYNVLVEFEAGTLGFGVVVLHSVCFTLLSIIDLIAVPQIKPITSITSKHATPIETALAIDTGPLMNSELSASITSSLKAVLTTVTVVYEAGGDPGPSSLN